MAYHPNFNQHEVNLPRSLTSRPESARAPAAGRASSELSTPLPGGRRAPPRSAFGPREPDFRASKHFVAGRSHPASDPLNANFEPRYDDVSHKTVRKLVGGEHTGAQAKMSGGAPNTEVPAPPMQRPLKAAASAAPDRSIAATAANVMARGGYLPPHPAEVLAARSAVAISAPPAAPRVESKAVNTPRPPSHPAVIEYRYSKGIARDDHSLVTARTLTPLNAQQDVRASKDAFMTSASQYYANLHRGKSSNVF